MRAYRGKVETPAPAPAAAAVKPKARGPAEERKQPAYRADPELPGTPSSNLVAIAAIIILSIVAIALAIALMVR
jgi:hypothetical protein